MFICVAPVSTQTLSETLTNYLASQPASRRPRVRVCKTPATVWPLKISNIKGESTKQLVRVVDRDQCCGALHGADPAALALSPTAEWTDGQFQTPSNEREPCRCSLLLYSRHKLCYLTQTQALRKLRCRLSHAGYWLNPASVRCQQKKILFWNNSFVASYSGQTAFVWQRKETTLVPLWYPDLWWKLKRENLSPHEKTTWLFLASALKKKKSPLVNSKLIMLWIKPSGKPCRRQHLLQPTTWTTQSNLLAGLWISKSTALRDSVCPEVLLRKRSSGHSHLNLHGSLSALITFHGNKPVRLLNSLLSWRKVMKCPPERMDVRSKLCGFLPI